MMFRWCSAYSLMSSVRYELQRVVTLHCCMLVLPMLPSELQCLNLAHFCLGLVRMRFVVECTPFLLQFALLSKEREVQLQQLAAST